MDDARYAFLLDLLRAHGPSGREADAARVWRAEAETFASVEVDRVGGSYLRVGPPGPGGVLLLAHVDEIGLLVTHVTDDEEDGRPGLLRVRPLGTWDRQVLVGQRVQVRTGAGALLPGVVGRTPVHLLRDEPAERVVGWDDLWVDIGARDDDDALSVVAVGDTIVPAPEATALRGRRLASKALDDRTGCWVVLEAARLVALAGGARVPVNAAACTLEETLGDGGRAAAHRVAPDVTIVVDVTHAADVPGVERSSTGRQALGAGPVLSRGLGLDDGLALRLAGVADAAGIPFTVQALYGESTTYTDIDGALDAHAGSATALVSLPLRHMHSPAEVCDLGDLEHAASLLATFCLSLTGDEAWDR